jgi:hypothetical protein
VAGLFAISIGSSSSSLRILDQRRHGFGLHLIWGHGCSGDGTPRGRADVLLAQNGYRRLGDWAATAEGDAAPIEADGPTGRCSCWRDGNRVIDIDYWCVEHPILRQRWPP